MGPVGPLSPPRTRWPHRKGRLRALRLAWDAVPGTCPRDSLRERIKRASESASHSDQRATASHSLESKRKGEARMEKNTSAVSHSLP